MTYNQKSVLEARLRSNAVLRRGYDSKNIYLEVENQFAPIGIRYQQLKQFEDVFPSQLPKTVIILFVFFKVIIFINIGLQEMQRVELFKLRQAETFNLTGQVEVLTTDSGKEVKITGENLKN